MDPLPSGGAVRSGFHDCWREAFAFTDDDFASGTVLDLWNFSQKQQLIDRGVPRLSEVSPVDLGLTAASAQVVPAEGLTKALRQWFQVSGTWPGGGQFFLDSAGLRAAMEAWQFPLHFIDFETSAVAIPFRRGQRPYETVAFQFSHHVLKSGGRQG